MVSVLGILGLLFVVALHTLIAAVMTRFFRLRLETTWGTAGYVAFLIPVALFISTLVLTGPLGLGVDLGSSAVVLALLVLLPLSLGATIDVLYVEHPEEYELPEPAE
ncbi:MULTISPECIES: hypothetical protein [unclassified Haloparvum]|uniref:hypothetical protein n=1 Tax=Haloparvum sp. PAK95 TaxID=3418962 RepID=UPI003D2F4CA7